MDPGPDLIIVLLGNTGVGKSAAGNTILGRAAFESKTSFSSGKTLICEETGNVFGKTISVVDTPGILGSEPQIKTRCQEVLQSSRPCLFLVVVRIGRFTAEQENAVEAAIGAVGQQSLDKCFLLFTGGDTLKNMSVNDFILQDSDSSLPGVVQRFSGRFHLFSNAEGQEQVEQLLQKSGHLRSSPDGDVTKSDKPEVRRIVLIGPSGSGKSLAGNVILGSAVFETDCDFNEIGKQPACGSAPVEGGQITVVDSAGLTAEDLTLDQLKDVIKVLVQQTEAGPHVFVFVVKIGRLSSGDTRVLRLLTRLFDRDLSKFTMVLFTHGDALGNQSLDHKIQSNSCVSELVLSCGGRYVVFDNTLRGNREQVRTFMNLIDEMFRANNGQRCSSDTFSISGTHLHDGFGSQRF